MADRLKRVRFTGRLRPSQKAASKVIRRELKSGERELHIVAPPGSGKTVLGLHVWADLVKRPALVLSPNSAIQAQWVARARELFHLDGHDDAVVTDPTTPGILTSLTYQSITLPRRGDADLDGRALDHWIETLIEEGEAEDPTTARTWIDGLRRANPDYHADRLGSYRKKVRDEDARDGEVLANLHASSRGHLDRLVEAEVGLIVLDECHHLLQHWGRVLAAVRERFPDPVILGLTATPPDLDDADPQDADRYRVFFGPIDYEVPVPALVRDGNLAPYQDLAYFVRPSMAELDYLAGVDDAFDRLVADLRAPRSDGVPGDAPRTLPLDEWTTQVLFELQLPTGDAKDWSSFRRRDPAFADAARVHLARHDRPLPEHVPSPGPIGDDEAALEDGTLVVLDRYVRHGLRRSTNRLDHALAETAIDRLRLLGTQITETGMRPCASPVGRVMAYASAKVEAVKRILIAEHATLGDAIRAVIVTDFEKSSATALVEGVLDAEAGGAIAAFRALLTDPATDALDPVLMTGSTVLVDDDLVPRLRPFLDRWIAEHDLEITIDDVERDGYHEFRGRGRHWQPRHYIQMLTEAFQQGVTKCLVGTRGLLGEGWDASRINVLVDLTTVTTSMSINQLRGRSFRLDKQWPGKVANNWDVVCLAEEFRRGFDDYRRFKRKHAKLFGVCEDEAIEQGVGHVHAAFTDARPEGIADRMDLFNEAMLQKAARRDEARRLWRIGTPFDETAREAIEVKMAVGNVGFPPFTGRRSRTEWTEGSLVEAIGIAVAGALREAGEIPKKAAPRTGDRGEGWVRSLLQAGGDDEAGEVFAEAMQQVLGPLENPRYMIPREVRIVEDTWLSRTLPTIVGRFFKRSRRHVAMHHAVPKRLARNKERAEIFQRHWNAVVSPGDVVYGFGDAGRAAVQNAIARGQSPSASFHRKKVYG